MAKATSHVPEGLPAVIPQLVVKDARKVVEFVVGVFGGQAGHMMPSPDGKHVIHGMFHIGGATVFVSDAQGFAQPTSANLMVYVPDVDAVIAKATAAGAKVLAPAMDMFWGDRWAMIADPWGTIWQVATHKEKLEPDEMMRRMAANAK